MFQSPVCTSNVLEWVAVSLTIFGMDISWWLLDSPLVFTYGFKVYFQSVAWQCFRQHLCGLAALHALLYAQTPQERAYIYYTGPFYDTFE